MNSHSIEPSIRSGRRPLHSALLAVLLTNLLFLWCCPAHAAHKTHKKFSGNVSWYGPRFNGKKTASGEIFNMNARTCAHRTLPFGTKVLVENPKNGKSVVVEVNDRGPYAKGRVLDLSRGAAKELGILLGGTAYVECTVLPDGGKKTSMIPADLAELPVSPFGSRTDEPFLADSRSGADTGGIGNGDGSTELLR